MHVKRIRELTTLLVSDYSFSYAHNMHMHVYKFLRTLKKILRLSKLIHFSGISPPFQTVWTSVDFRTDFLHEREVYRFS